jgi:response regulator RpfG family c-di-GMP phosphodiesterase
LDFGITRVIDRRLTEPGMILGSLAYVAPEQAQDSGDVDIRADIFGLGGVLFWCLTGQTPFAAHGDSTAALGQRLHAAPPRVRTIRPEIAAELDAFVACMMAQRPEDRPAHPEAVRQALLPFLKKPRSTADVSASSANEVDRRRTPVLIVDDEAPNRELCRYVLESAGLSCAEACDGQAALDAIAKSSHDLVLLDIDMPVLTGIEVLRRLRAAPPAPHLKIIMLSGRATADEMAQMMLEGADDYLTTPFSTTQLQARVKTALRLKEAQDRSDALFGSMLAVNHELEQNVQARDSDLIQARNALVLALAELVAYRDTETGAHLMRLQRYCRCLADKASLSPAFQGSIDAHFTAMLECCAPLHDIGKAGVPDYILLKPGKLTPEEMVIMQSHTTIGANVLEKVAREHGFARAFLKMATDITRHHHERFDGRGYPDRLAGDAIPLSARIVAIADVYDALRSQRVYKAALSHDEALRIMLTHSAGHFDPALLGVFSTCADQFERLYRELVD